METQLKAGINIKLLTCDDKEIFTDDDQGHGDSQGHGESPCS
jgi:hypothetical protein